MKIILIAQLSKNQCQQLTVLLSGTFFPYEYVILI